MQRLLPEWAPQWGVLIAWPHPDTDWADILDAAEQTYCALATAVLDVEHLLVVCRDDLHQQHVEATLQQAGANLGRLRTAVLPFNDTWARDFGPLTVSGEQGLMLLDYRFNGWGNKFEAAADNAVTQRLSWRVPVRAQALVLEGGSVEINSQGLLLTTSHCLLNPNRNPGLNQTEIEQQLREQLGATDILWLHHGYLEGDDTDAHIDTLARFCDDRTIAYVRCDDLDDSHYPALKKMEAELQQHAERHQLKLVALPMTTPAFDDQGARLPGTYANFLIINGAVLMPTYNSDRDADALAQLQSAFPDRAVIGVPCLPLIHQHGSLHCVTMQLPEGVL